MKLVGDDEAIISLDGVEKKISLALVDGIVPGDYVLIHVGYALERIDTDEADRTLALMVEVGAIAQRASFATAAGPGI
jgi:hydrogenase expression/formation protein HypC